MEKRCDGFADCKDSSDEDQCFLIRSFQGYLKHLLPPPLGNESSTEVNISFTIEEILDVDEVDGILKIKIFQLRSWFEPRFEYTNLKKSLEKNQLTAKEKENMWIPWTVFENLEALKSYNRTELFKIVNVVPNPQFSFKRSSRTSKHNTRIFDGSKNALLVKDKYTIDWLCDYDLQWYPFDTQHCYLHFWQNEKSLISLNPGTVNYTGPTQLPQHFVKAVKICATRGTQLKGVWVEVILGRPLIGSLLVVYLPTGILIIISNLLVRFHHFYMDMVIAQNVTLLLVLATL